VYFGVQRTGSLLRQSLRSSINGSPVPAAYTPPIISPADDLNLATEPPPQRRENSFIRQDSVRATSGGMGGTVESCIVVLTFIALGGVLFYVQTVLVPLIMAIFVASMMVPMVDALTDRPLRIFDHTWCQPCCSPVLKLEKKYPNWVCSFFTSVLTLRLPNIMALVVVILGVAVFGLCSGVIMYRSVADFVAHAPGCESFAFFMCLSDHAMLSACDRLPQMKKDSRLLVRTSLTL
jgi:hypothetical protein